MTRELTGRQRFLRACRREPVEATPVWFMRQAGRTDPDYRALRQRYSLMDLCRQPELAAEVALQPVRRHGVDAAVMFADIMLPLIGIGIDIELVDSVGPLVKHPVQEAKDLAMLRPIEPEQDVWFVLETARILRRELGERTAVVGFSGAPFTLASYLVEGKPSREFLKTKAMMYGAPELWHGLMDRLTAIMTAYLHAKVDAGVDALQLFDSWVGALSPADYERYVRPYTQGILCSLHARGVPLIHFGTNTATLLPQMKDDGATAIGVDWRIPLDTAWDTIGHDLAIQGNLDPAVLLGPWEVVAEQATDVLRRAGGRPGHIFNTGHGLHPETDLDQIRRLVDFVHEHEGMRDEA